MKNLVILGMLLLATSSWVSAHSPKMPLDLVQFQLTSKDWVKSHEALLMVNISASLSNVDLVKARSDMMARLAKIAPGAWHLTRFQRSQDTSGLEHLNVDAQVRVSQEKLTNIYQQAKAVSFPGATYRIDGIEFDPSLSEIEQVRDKLRTELYQRVNVEIDHLNKAYPSQHYSLNRLVFSESGAPIAPKMMRAMAINTMAMEAPATNPPLTQSNELALTATVQVASNRLETSVATPINQ